MRGEHHVAAALDHAELLLHSARGAIQVRRGDDVKDNVRRRRHVRDGGPEGTHTPAPLEVERDRAARQEHVPGASGREWGQETESAHRLGPTATMTPMSPVAAARYSPRRLTEGERWTALELAALRQHRYRAGGWLAFLRNSLRRSEATRRAHPAIVRQARRWAALGGAAWLVAWRLGRGRLEPAPQLGAGLVWWASVWRMLDWHLGMAEGGDGVPRERLARADAVTMVRYWLVPLLPALTGTPRGLP